eukprot:1300392-Pleurochrysis_carterae.AAC.1
MESCEYLSDWFQLALGRVTDRHGKISWRTCLGWQNSTQSPVDYPDILPVVPSQPETCRRAGLILTQTAAYYPCRAFKNKETGD